MNTTLIQIGEIMLYEITIGLQVAGAVILLLKYFSNTYKSILQEYFSDGEPAIRDDDDNIILKKSKIQKSARTVYTYRISFLLIVVGYILNVFGQKNDDMLTSFFTILVWTIVALFTGWVIPCIGAKIWYKNDIQINLKELEKYVQNVHTPMTRKEIDEMFKFKSN